MENGPKQDKSGQRKPARGNQPEVIARNQEGMMEFQAVGARTKHESRPSRRGGSGRGK